MYLILLKAVFLVPDLPKTRSGKIMRRLLRDVAEGRDFPEKEEYSKKYTC